MKHPVFFVASLLGGLLCLASAEAGTFFRDHAAVFDAAVSNAKGRMLRVNDPDLALHPTYGKRPEALTNGLTLVRVPEDLFQVARAELRLALWGGHPHTSEKHFYLNGRGPYPLPDDGAAAGHCAYSHPVIPLAVSHLVSGSNSVQFACERGSSFWGHFIVDAVTLRCYLEANHPDLAEEGLAEFGASVAIDGPGTSLGDRVSVRLDCSPAHALKIASVSYFARYVGFDDTGSGVSGGWHGYAKDGAYINHVGTVAEPPFEIVWDATMVPTQDAPMALKAVVEFKNGLHYETDVLDGLQFPATRPLVALYACDELPVPFWSRANRLREATITIPERSAPIESTRLLVNVWDGGAGTVEAPFTINGHPYHIISGRSNHDLVHTNVPIDVSHLRPGQNALRLLSNTEHHGIEVLLPGPCIVVRYGAHPAR